MLAKINAKRALYSARWSTMKIENLIIIFIQKAGKFTVEIFILSLKFVLHKSKEKNKLVLGLQHRKLKQRPI